MSDELPERLRRYSTFTSFRAGARTFSEAADRIEALEAENAELKALLRERDGGVHDQDCKALRSYGPRKCNCGHDALDAVLTRETGNE